MNGRTENQIIFVFNGIGFFRDQEEAHDRCVEIKEKTPGVSFLPGLCGGRSWNSSLAA